MCRFRIRLRFHLRACARGGGDGDSVHRSDVLLLREQDCARGRHRDGVHVHRDHGRATY